MITREEAIIFVDSICQNSGEQVLGYNVVDKIYSSIEVAATEDEKKDPWAWVKTEYCALFKAKNPDKGGHVKESVARMKKMFAAMPEMRKEDVLLTVKLYLSQTDSRYIRLPHYFLKKGVGTSAIYEFDTWFEKYQETQEAGKGRSNVINTMQ